MRAGMPGSGTHRRSLRDGWRALRQDARLRSRLAMTIAVAVATTLLLALLSELLLHPQRLPVATGRLAETGALRTTLEQLDAYAEHGTLPWRDWAASGDNLAARRSAMATHPLVFILGAFLPPGGSLSLLLALHLLAGAIATFFLVRRARLEVSAALFASLVFYLSGHVLTSGLERTSEFGLSLAAALLPPLLLGAVRVLEAPTARRGVVLGGAVSAIAVSGDLLGILVTCALAAACFPGVARLAERRRWSRRTAVVASLACAGGLALGAYRWLPFALDESARAELLSLLALPWWSGSDAIRLPYHLGAVTLITFVVGARNLARHAGGPALLPLALVGLALAVAGPRSAFPYLGFFFGMTAAAAFVGFLKPTRSLPRHAWAIIATVALVLEAQPHHEPLLRGQTREGLVRTPPWAEQVDRLSLAGRVAFVGETAEEDEALLAWLGRPRLTDRAWSDFEQVPAPYHLGRQNVRYIVSDRPDTTRRFFLMRRSVADGKYLYKNRAWVGPIYWTREVETFDASTHRRTEAAGRVATASPHAVALAADTVAGWTPATARGQVAESTPTRNDFGPPERWKLSVNGYWFELDVAAPALAVVAETYRRGLRATVDGEPATIHATASGQVAVPVPAGRHEVELSFEPPGLVTGLTISGLCLVGLPFVVIVPALRRRARRKTRRYRPSDFLVPQSSDATQEAAPRTAGVDTRREERETVGAGSAN